MMYIVLSCEFAAFKLYSDVQSQLAPQFAEVLLFIKENIKFVK